MQLTLSPETRKLIEDHMEKGDYPTTDALLQAALVALDQFENEPLDEETLAAIEEGEAEADRGEGRPWEEVKAELRAKYFPDRS